MNFVSYTIKNGWPLSIQSLTVMFYDIFLYLMQFSNRNSFSPSKTRANLPNLPAGEQSLFGRTGWHRGAAGSISYKD